MVEFVEDIHCYVNSKGIIIPSVSRLVSFAFPNTYDGIPERILKAKAEYGTKLHEILEYYDDGKLDLEAFNFNPNIDPNMKSSLKQYIELKKKYMINPKNQETIVSFEDRYAGRYDKLGEDGKLWDVKTTSSKNLDKWACQLGLYYMAMGVNEEIGYIIWLPKKGKGEVLLIEPWSNEKCLKLLEDYEQYEKTHDIAR